MEKVYRKLTKTESEILDVMLKEPFTGSEEIKKQLVDCKVRLIPEYHDNWGSIEFIIKNKVEANVESRVPVSAQTLDADNVPVDFFLHVVNGIVDELEITKADNSSLIKPIDPKKVEVVYYKER